MANNNFKPILWATSSVKEKTIFNNEDRTPAPILPPIPSPSKDQGFTPSRYLVPGWRGDSLISKSAIFIKNLRSILLKDARRQFGQLNLLNKSLRINIFNEFVFYSNQQHINCSEIENFTDLWDQLKNNKAKFHKPVSDFIEQYCFKVITVYMYRIRFILELSYSANINITENNLLNPTSFFTKLFPKGGHRELQCEALQANQYSWYRPSSEFTHLIRQLKSQFKHISITEMMIIFSEESLKEQLNETSFSHSLSHKSFGLFLNELIIQFPKWLNRSSNIPPIPTDDPFIINTKYSGDNLTSLILSHWLGQEENIQKKWNEIICPDFYGSLNFSDQYIRICHELKFLTYLIKIANHQNFDHISLICDVMNNKYKHDQTNFTGQRLMLNDEPETKNIYYSRIVLNFAKLPNKNPHHALLNQINAQKQSLIKDGLIFVFTNQKLFVPSKNEKMKQFLKEFKVESFFSLENLHGKGEIPNYLYIISVRNHNNFNKSQQDQLPKNKEVCLHFRLAGTLLQFRTFNLFVNEILNFINTKLISNTSIYRKDLDKNLSVEFYQDAIVDGNLLHSTSSDPNNITHPHFFKNITNSSLTFDKFFQIEQITPQSIKKETNNFTTNLLGINNSKTIRFPLLLIVNYSDSSQIKLEISSFESYAGKLEKYGNAFYQYYGLIPKKPNININCFREYFTSNIGNQIIQLSLSGGQTKIKSKVKTILIPKFLGQILEGNLKLDLNAPILAYGENDLFSTHPNVLQEQFKQSYTFLSEYAVQYPAHTLSMLSHLKVKIDNLINHIDNSSSNTNHINFSNPLILEPLMKIECKSIFPTNKEVFIQFIDNDPASIHKIFNNGKIKKEDNNFYLSLYNEDKEIIRFYSDHSLLIFINYLLSSVTGETISTILQNIKVPTIEQLGNIIENFSLMEDCFKSIAKQTKELISQIFIKQITKQ